MGLFTMLFGIFLILKLTNFIDWSWWWIASPLLFEVIVSSIVVIFYLNKKRK
jgi:hypothetical protein